MCVEASCASSVCVCVCGHTEHNITMIIMQCGRRYKPLHPCDDSVFVCVCFFLSTIFNEIYICHILPCIGEAVFCAQPRESLFCHTTNISAMYIYICVNINSFICVAYAFADGFPVNMRPGADTNNIINIYIFVLNSTGISIRIRTICILLCTSTHICIAKPNATSARV